jgi:high-affinity iron transporter
MIESFLITSRETLEVSLVVGIVLSYLTKTDNAKYRKNVYYGIVGGIGFSIVAAVLFNFFAGGFTGEVRRYLKVLRCC